MAVTPPQAPQGELSLRIRADITGVPVSRPADVETNGVKEIKTKGALDNYFFMWPHGGRPAQ